MIVKLRVEYVANGATDGDAPTDLKTYNIGANVTVLGNSGGLTKCGYEFTAWNTAPDGTGSTLEPGVTFKISEDMSLYAKWEATHARPSSSRVERRFEEDLHKELQAIGEKMGFHLPQVSKETTAALDYLAAPQGHVKDPSEERDCKSLHARKLFGNGSSRFAAASSPPSCATLAEHPHRAQSQEYHSMHARCLALTIQAIRE
jgi:hypothetical protein